MYRAHARLSGGCRRGPRTRRHRRGAALTVLEIDSGTGPRRVELETYLDAALEERAQDEAYAWIKELRYVHVDGVPFRSRFTFRGDSLWWFAELYLHKQQAVLRLMRMIAAFEALIERERPLAVRVVRGADSEVLAGAAVARQVRFTPAARRWPHMLRLLAIDARAAALRAAALSGRLRGRRAARHPARIVAFVHRAFWREGIGDASAESYIGPVLQQIEQRSAPGDVRYVAVGPRANFRARHWWDGLFPAGGSRATPIERYTSLANLSPSRQVWRERHRSRRALWSSEELRAHSMIRGCDCWPVIRDELAGVALLQFPWSARAMDEAAAALDTLEPAVAVTYAEAGGWGRAIALECRRRGIPLAGLQHGFIYRHWLNYRHEPDEMAPAASGAGDPGFPRPALTLVFDGYAARHLTTAGRFPQDAVAVTGSPRLDELVAIVRRITPDEIRATRRAAGAEEDQSLVVLVTKQREVAAALPDLLDAVRQIPRVRLAIKPHPAETGAVYAAAVAGTSNVRVLPATVPLPPLLAASQALVTVNSTVAIDALSIGLPSLVLGLPNNLSPFVHAGAMAGARTPVEIRTTLERLLYDQEFRRQIQHTAERFTSEFRVEHDGQAAARAAEAVLMLARTRT